MRARVEVFPRREILDPQGKAIHAALERSGFAGVQSVRAGKSFEIELGTADRAEAEADVARMCDKLLSNPIVEEYRFEIVEEGRP